MKTLVLIPARGGSKGIPGKNTKILEGKPLLHYTIDIARQFFPDTDICLSTDADYIIDCAREAGLEVPFLRPATLASDTATSNDVIRHALDFFRDQKGILYERVLLLQPTSPFRRPEHVAQALAHFHVGSEMVIGVKEAEANPYYVLLEEAPDGSLHKSKSANFTRRQDCPKVWQINGALYLFSVAAFRQYGSLAPLRKEKIVMDAIASVDLDNPLDWLIAECIAAKGLHII